MFMFKMRRKKQKGLEDKKRKKRRDLKLKLARYD